MFIQNAGVNLFLFFLFNCIQKATANVTTIAAISFAIFGFGAHSWQFERFESVKMFSRRFLWKGFCLKLNWLDCFVWLSISFLIWFFLWGQSIFFLIYCLASGTVTKRTTNTCVYFDRYKIGSMHKGYTKDSRLPMNVSIRSFCHVYSLV